MYRKWTKNDIEASKARFRRLYAKSPIEYRFLCGHDIQSEDDEDALDYYMIGVWLVQHRKYSDAQSRNTPGMTGMLCCGTTTIINGMV